MKYHCHGGIEIENGTFQETNSKEKVNRAKDS